METEKKCSNKFCSCRKTPARPEVMRLANGYDVFQTASIMGQLLHPSPSQGDYRFSMRILNKHTEPPLCHLRILPWDSHFPPILSAPILSAPTCHIYQQTMHPSANLPKLIYPYPIPANQCPSTPSLSCLPFTPCPSPICNFTAYILPWTCWYTPAYLPMTKPASYFYVLFIATFLLDHIFSASFFYFYLSLLIMFFLKYLLLRIVTDNSPPKYLFMIETLWLMHWRVLKPHTS